MRKPPSWFTPILGVAFIALVVLFIRQRLQLIQLRADNQAISAADRQQKRDIARLSRQIAVQADDATGRNRAAQRTIDGAGRNGASHAGVISYSNIAKEHPEFAAIRDRETRRMILRQYGDAFAALNLPPDKLAQLKNLLVERQMSSEDAQEAARAAGLQPGTPAFAQAVAEAYNDMQQSIVALIGQDGQNALQQAQLAATIKNFQIANTYAPDFLDAGVALTSDQAQGLAQVLASTTNTPPGLTPGGYHQPDPQTWLSQADQDTLTRASQVLSPAQLNVLKTDLAEQNQRNAIMRTYFQRG